MKRSALAVTALLIFTGGAFAASQQQQLEAVRSTPDYKSGYSDGCSHAVWGTGPDHPRSDRPAAYRYGWFSGYNGCSRGGAVNGATGLMGNAGANAHNPNN